ncbi:MAG: phosphoribosyltransferase [Acidimicrobiia bacterium]
MFRDRTEAGRMLAQRLEHLRGGDLVVLGLPRGGVPVASEVARGLSAPLDVIMVRKLGVPFQPELAMGAIGEGGVRILNTRVLSLAGVNDHQLAAIEAKERRELERRVSLYRGAAQRISLEGRTAVIVDDGIATGSTIRAAAEVAREQGAAQIVIAAPVAPADTLAALESVADEVVVVDIPEPFLAIGSFYRDFTQTNDTEVTRLLESSRG